MNDNLEEFRRVAAESRARFARIAVDPTWTTDTINERVLAKAKEDQRRLLAGSVDALGYLEERATAHLAAYREVITEIAWLSGQLVPANDPEGAEQIPA